MGYKTIINLGESGESWKGYIDNLGKAVMELYGGVIPYHIPKEEIGKRLFENYKIGGRCPRSETSVIQTGLEILLKKSPFFDRAKMVNNVCIFKEWVDVERLKKNTRISVDKKICPVFLHSNQTDNKHTKSGIIVAPLFQEGGKDIIGFSFPTMPFADYSRIIYSIYSLDGSYDEGNQGEIEKKRMKLVNDLILVGGHTLSLKEASGDYALLFSAFYILDFIFGFLAAKSSDKGFSKTVRGIGDDVLLDRLLEKLKMYRYKCCDEIYGGCKKYHKRTITDKVGKKLLKMARIITEKMSNDSFWVPSYRVDTTLMFELYSLYVIHNEHPRTKYQYRLVSQWDSKTKAIPDLYYVGDDTVLILDAKYKFQYRELSYFDLNDVDRMAKYISIIKPIASNIKKGFKYFFVFPGVSEPEKQTGEFVSKRTISLPNNESRVRLYFGD